MVRIASTAGLALAAALASVPAHAETVGYVAALNAASETPPNGSMGTGDLKASYDSDSKVLTYTVTYAGLSGPATAAHFHGPAPAGKAAGVMVPVNGAVASPISGKATLTDDQAKALSTGMLYFNVHTADNKGGEIRGQVTKGM